MRHQQTTSLQSQSGPAWKGITRIFTIQKIKTKQSAVKIAASVFWDSGAINVQYYNNRRFWWPSGLRLDRLAAMIAGSNPILGTDV
jgi:hypothetical protein